MLLIMILPLHVTYHFLGPRTLQQLLGCPILIGEPGKSDIETMPANRLIRTIDMNNESVLLPYQHNNHLFNRNFICRSSMLNVVHPGESMEIDIPTMLQSEDHLLFTPRARKDEPHLPAQIVEVKGRQILVKNSSVMVVGV